MRRCTGRPFPQIAWHRIATAVLLLALLRDHEACRHRSRRDKTRASVTARGRGMLGIFLKAGRNTFRRMRPDIVRTARLKSN
jgi:hypothetical protein